MSGARGRQVVLPTTSWTLINAAAGEAADEEARREVFARYYKPVCAYVAAITRDASAAEDHAHDFFLQKVFKAEGEGLLEMVDRERRFRPYLKRAVANYLKDRWKRENWLQAKATWPDGRDSGWGDIAGGYSSDADDVFHREWVRMLLTRALAKVRAMCEAKNEVGYLEIFLARFAGEGEKPPSWGEIGARYQLDQKTARHRAETLQRRFRAALRDVLIEEQGSPEAAEEELATLLAILRNAM